MPIFAVLSAINEASGYFIVCNQMTYSNSRFSFSYLLLDNIAMLLQALFMHLLMELPNNHHILLSI